MKVVKHQMVTVGPEHIQQSGYYAGEIDLLDKRVFKDHHTKTYES